MSGKRRLVLALVMSVTGLVGLLGSSGHIGLSVPTHTAHVLAGETDPPMP